MEKMEGIVMKNIKQRAKSMLIGIKQQRLLEKSMAMKEFIMQKWLLMKEEQLTRKP